MSTKNEMVKITHKEGAFQGYLALPAKTPAPGVIVVQEIFGVNSHIRSVCDRLAEAGYLALAPDMYWRIAPGYQSGYTPEEIQAGMKLKEATSDKQAVLDVEAAMTALRARKELKGDALGITGFCWGGLVTYLAACRLKFACAASYYGGGIVNFLGDAKTLNTPILFHFGELDHAITLEHVEKVRQAVKSRPNAEVHVYSGAQHGFHCDQRGSYNAASAKQAWGRTMELFKRHLG
ncbi:MAG: dienelactone hydrolase family protein [Deltaproteobacteria bacterium]|nr:dienelactone hydrolase family protein [Deltaproteobacteria bacterium]